MPNFIVILSYFSSNYLILEVLEIVIMFKYGGFKLFLFKIFTGLILLVFGIFLTISLWTHSPSDPGLGKLKSYGALAIFGYFGALASSSLFLLGFFLMY